MGDMAFKKAPCTRIKAGTALYTSFAHMPMLLPMLSLTSPITVSSYPASGALFLAHLDQSVVYSS